MTTARRSSAGPILLSLSFFGVRFTLLTLGYEDKKGWRFLLPCRLPYTVCHSILAT